MELEFLSPGAIVWRTLGQFLPVWIAMAAILLASFLWRRRLGTYGRIFGSPASASSASGWCCSGC